MGPLLLLPTTKDKRKRCYYSAISTRGRRDCCGGHGGGLVVIQMDLKFEKDRVMNACKIQWLHFDLKLFPQGEGLDE
jgi:hypothetical protein